jgi:hypothetical protein
MSAGFENATTKSVEVNGAPFIFRIAAKKRFDKDDGVLLGNTPTRPVVRLRARALARPGLRSS